ncbi:glycosyltransferase WbsX family protein [Vibrio fluvialis]|uniref:glycosyltransferase WbsX family protein n=1 Tax=Vibrio fluvialis TaxID=676 RepID=UPI001F441E1B|nr:glycoside hydrolase family 99-like domain-containing protein [Vibrio fluvialis]MCE7602178.1 glycoside hydrolase family 99-like domain-containing protein [Vibrio fluvialis]
MERIKLKESFTYYLPQYHEIDENNQWWGEGFTEWVNVRNAKVLVKGQEINYPGELGYYCLDDVSVVEKQYKIAKENSISTFCFWHYWFDDNDMLLQKVSENILKSNIEVKFCFAWANHSWFNKTKGILLKKQKYDFNLELYFNYLLPFFKDARYTKIDGKPVFVIYDIKSIPNFFSFKAELNNMAIEAGFPGLFWIGEGLSNASASHYGVDFFLSTNNYLAYRSFIRDWRDKIVFKLQKIGVDIVRQHDYLDVISGINKSIKSENQMPIIFPNWDSTIRHSNRGILVKNSTPKAFEKNVIDCKRILSEREYENRMLMIKSWNEWAEGNFMEPSEKYGDAYLKVFSKHFKL